MGDLWVLGVSVAVIIVGYVVGSIGERRHFASIRRREEQLQGVLATTLETPPDDWQLADPQLVSGSVVVSLDAFKSFVAGLKAFIGGRLTTFEPLLDRARREALLRLKAEAAARGCDTLLNVRLETAAIAVSAGNTTAGIEVLAFGTAVRRAPDPS